MSESIKTYVTWKGATYWARLVIPAPLRDAFDGAYQFQRNTGETDRYKATLKAMPWVTEWKARIAAAAETRVDPIRVKIDKLAERFAAMKGRTLDGAAHDLFCETVAFVLRDLKPDQRDAALEGLEASKDGRAVLEGPKGHTPWLVKLDDWQTYMAGRKSASLVKENIETVRSFSAMFVNPAIESITRAMAQQWVEAELDKPGKNGLPMNAGTVKKKVYSGLSGYWQHLVYRNVVSAERVNPFKGLKIVDKVSKRDRAACRKLAFPQSDLGTILHQSKVEYGYDQWAAELLGLYMGWRQGELFLLRCDDVKVDDEGVRYIAGGSKTESGFRRVPMHPDIDAVVDTLIGKSPDGYLLHGQPKDRTEPTASNFTELKKALGYGAQHTFHCLRHNFATALDRAKKHGVPERLVEELMGHRDPDSGKEQKGDTTGRYIEQYTLTEKRDALVKAMPSFISLPVKPLLHTLNGNKAG